MTDAMRPQLMVAGLLIMSMGGVFVVLEIPLVYSWSVVFLAGGAMMVLASPFVSQSPGPVEAPQGYKFCRYCTAEVPVEAERCPKCDGLQRDEQ
jgi:hypothetical protein